MMPQEPLNPMDSLVEGSRFTTGIIRDSDPANVTEQEAADVIAAVRSRMAGNRMSLTFVARSLGYSASVISQVFSRTYEGNWRQIALDLDRWLGDQVKSDEVFKPAGFVRIKVAEEIFAVAEAAMHLKGIGLVFGPSGIGKTLALRALAAEKPGAVFVSLETIACSAAGVIEAIARTMRLIPSARQLAATRHSLAGIKEKLQGTPRLLVIDEIHKLCGQAGDKALTVLRDLYDATQSPMLWCGTTDLVAYLERETGDAREPLAQIRRRITICRDLTERTMAPGGGPGEPLYTIDEIRAVFARSKMRLAADATRMLVELANVADGGHLGACAALVVMATTLHERRAEVLTADMLRGALGLMVHRRALAHLDQRLLADGRRPVCKVG
jgi:DNA transposition AAA+ family ATPase